MCGWAARRCLEATLRVSRALVRTFLPFGAGLFSLVFIVLGAIPGSPPLRILTALYALLTSREFLYSVCNFVDALVAIYQLRVLVRYVCTRYVCTPSLPPLPPEVGLVGCSRLWGVPGNRLPSKPGGLAPPPVCERGHFYFIGTNLFIISN